MVLKARQEPRARGAFAGPVLQHAADIGGKRHVLHQVLGKISFTLLHIGIGKNATGGSEG